MAEAEITEYEVLRFMFAEEPKSLLTRPPGINGSCNYREPFDHLPIFVPWENQEKLLFTASSFLDYAPVRVNFSAYIYRIDKLDERNMVSELKFF